MATRRRKRTTRRRTAPARRKPRAAAPQKPRDPLVSPETAQTILAIFLLLLGAVLLLSLFNIGGPLGRGLGNWTAQLLGWTNVLLPALLLWFGLTLLTRQEITRGTVIGSVIMVVALSALTHVFAGNDPLKAAKDGTHGGLVGYGLATTTKYALGTVGTTLVYLALLAVGGFVAVNRPLKRAAELAALEEQARPKQESRPVPGPAPAAVPRQSDSPSEPEFVPRAVDTAWEQPPLELLSDDQAASDPGDTGRNTEIIERTLANFNIVAKVENVNVGPSVTQYEIRPEPGVKLNQITALDNDLALALAAHPIRIEAPIPGKSTVGIEVPNPRKANVRLRKIFGSPRWKKSGALPLALGLDVSGNQIITDLATMPHLLIAGATGSGKSIGINTILTSLLYTHSPKHLRLLLVDPKRVELTLYNDIPHLIAPVIVDAPKVVNALKWVVSEMERRYRLFQEHGVKNIIEFNKAHPKETLPYLVVVVDELADLMAVSGKAVEATIVRVAQLARATGIHLVIATQRPSVDVITGLIKANFPSRMAFTVTSGTDSRTILDMTGAETLLGQGDMLFLPGNVSKPVRVQGAFVETKEIKRLTDFLKGKGTPTYDESITEAPSRGGGGGGDGNSDDPLYEEARTEVIRSRKASASLLQRRLKVGYARAARLLDMLEENGVIGPGDGAKAREILVESDE